LCRDSLAAGRWFTEDDRKGTARVVVIDKRLAHQYWPSTNPIGQSIDKDSTGGWATVIGVVGTVRVDSLEEDAADGMRYYPLAQHSDVAANFIVRTAGDSQEASLLIKDAVHSADPNQIVAMVVPLDILVSNSLAGRRFIVWMIAGFAGLALVLAIIGIYALISYVTAQRTSEIGIRMALGAERKGILRMVLVNAIRWVVVGLTLGSVFSLLFCLILNHIFVAFGSGILPSFSAAGLIILIAGALAGLIPARRAASLDPMSALRAD